MPNEIERVPDLSAPRGQRQSTGQPAGPALKATAPTAPTAPTTVTASAPPIYRVSLNSNPTCLVKLLPGGVAEVKFPSPQPIFYPAGKEPSGDGIPGNGKPFVVAAHGEIEAYNRACGIRGTEHQHTIDSVDETVWEPKVAA